MGRINDGIVVDRKTLAQLLLEESPSGTTKGGDEYVFSRQSLEHLAETIPKNLQEKLRLPILFYFDMTVRDACFLTDEIALEALQHLGELSNMRQIRDGRLWVSRAIAYSLMRKYPTVVQIVMR